MEPNTVRLLERESELAVLAAAADDARRGRGRLVVVEGAAGIGKSSLLLAAAESARARGLGVARACASELERSLTFGVARRLLERRPGGRRAVAPGPAAARAEALVAGRAPGSVTEELELAAARRFGAPRPLGMALWAAAVIEGGERGLAHAREAVAVLETSPSTLELIRALCTLGALLRSRERRVEARVPLRRALDLATGRGAPALAERARHELEATGARPRRAALRGRDALTPSELRVARLAADGRSNPEIAAELFVTRKTIEFHLHGAYRKLGISSRDDLARALGATGAAPGRS